MTELRILRKVLASNDELAAQHRALLDRARVLGINLMSGPGAGKTSLVERTVERLKDRLRIYVIEGDIKGDLDARRVVARGAPAFQINTQTQCHIDSFMISQVLPELNLDAIDLLIVENVGNLVCPAEFALGTHCNVTVLSTPEGSDKPTKYPLMFLKSDLLVINKIDLLPYVDFDLDQLEESLRRLKPDLPVLKLSCRTGAGLDAWTDWLEARLAEQRPPRT